MRKKSALAIEAGALLRLMAGNSILLANTLLYATAWGFVAVAPMPAA